MGIRDQVGSYGVVLTCVQTRGPAIPQDICGTPLLSHRSETPWEACLALRHQQVQLHVTPGE